jgi:WD40 repeat protein
VSRLTSVRNRHGRASNGYAYSAFISYSHALDEKLAPALQTALQQFAKPWYKLRALRVFRDDANLTVTAGLWGTLQEALEQSEFFILLASPTAAGREWIAREAEWWRTHKPIENLFIGLTDGELVWDARTGDFDWERTTALPATLRGAFTDEPRFADLRWARTKEHLSLDDPRFRDNVADIAAALHHVEKDQIAGEEVRQHRRTLRVAWSAAGMLAVLAIGATALGLVARSERNHAIAERQTAVSRLLASQALAQMQDKLDLGALLAVAAYRVKTTPEARDSLFEAIRRGDRLLAVFGDQGASVNVVRFEPEGALIAAGRSDGTIFLWDQDRQRVLPPLRGQVGAIRALAFSSDGKLLAALGVKGAVVVWRLDEQKTFQRVSAADLDAGTIAFVPDSSSLLVGTTKGLATWRPGGRVRTLLHLRYPVEKLAVAADGTIAAGGESGVTVLLARKGVPARPISLGGDAVVQDLAFDATGQKLAVIAGLRIFVWERRSRTIRILPATDATSVSFASHGMLATGALHGDVTLWTAEGAQDESVLRVGNAAVTSIAFDARHGVMASAGADRRIALWKIERGLRPLETLDDLAFVSPRTIAAGGDGRVVIQDLGSGSVRSLQRTPEGQIRLSASRDGRVLAARGFTSETVVVWNHERPEVPLRWRDDRPIAAAVDGAGRIVAAATQHGTLDLWQRGGRPQPTVLRVGTSPLTAIASAPSEQVFAVGAQDGAVSLARVGSSRVERLGRLEGASVTAVAFAPDGAWVAAGASNGSVALWRVRSRETRLFRGGEAPLTSVAFDPQGTAVAGGDEAGHVFFWDVGEGAARGRPLTFPNEVAAVAFDPSGRTLVVGLRGGTITLLPRALWDDAAAIDSLCARMGRRLSAVERTTYLPAGVTADPCG